MKTLLQSAGVLSFANDHPPETPATEEHAEVRLDYSPQASIPGQQTEMIQAISSPEMAMPEGTTEIESQRRRRKRRQKNARQRERKRQANLVEHVGNPEPENEDADEGVSLVEHTLSERGDLVDVSDDLRVESHTVADEETLRQQTEEADTDGIATHVVQCDSEALHVVPEVVEEQEHGGTHGGENPTKPQRLVDPTSNHKTASNQRNPTDPEPRTEQADSSHDALNQMSGTSAKNQTLTTSQMPPKLGLGPTIEMPSPSQHRFIIDSPGPPTAQQCGIEMTCPDFPESLAKLQDADLADSFRAGHMAALAHKVLADRLWRTVIFANYFSGSTPADIDLPQDFQSMNYNQQRFGVRVEESKSIGVGRPLPSQQAAVEDAVLLFLSQTKRDSVEFMEDFIWANRTMAWRLYSCLVEERVVTREELFGMFIDSYGGPEHEKVKVQKAWTVDGTGLEALFDGSGV
jgi:hypothetical protein